MSDESSHSPFFSFSSTPVLSSAYHPNLTTPASSSVPPFKTGLISTSNQSLCLLWDAMDHCPHISVEEQDSPADQIRDAWHISNEFQLQLYAQQESQ